MKVIFCIPTHDGTININTMLSIYKCINILNKYKYKYEIIYEMGSHINRIRNRLVYNFLQKNGDYLFFIDNDVYGFENGFEKMLKSKKLIIGIPYPKKGFNNSLLLNNIVNKRNLFDNSTEFNINLYRNELVNNDILKVKDIATGCLLISNNVFEKLISKVDVYIEDGDKIIGNFFHSGVVDNTYLTEDYWFCNLCNESKIDIYALIDCELSHCGLFNFKGNYKDFLLNIKYKNYSNL